MCDFDTSEFNSSVDSFVRGLRESGLALRHDMLSDDACTLWGKDDRTRDTGNWLSLVTHMTDSFLMACWYWEHVIDDNVRKVIVREVGLRDEADARAFVTFCCMLHDLGKATSAFQAMRPLGDRMAERGYEVEGFRHFSHASASGHLVWHELEDVLGVSPVVAGMVASVLSAHHGVTEANPRLVPGYRFRMKPEYGSSESWERLRHEIVAWAMEVSGARGALDRLGAQRGRGRQRGKGGRAGLIQVSAIVGNVDWAVSDESVYPLSGHVPESDALDRLVRGLRRLGRMLCDCPEEDDVSVDELLHLVSEELPDGARANEMQRIAFDVAGTLSRRSLVILEDLMGRGKTEAASIIVSRLRRRLRISGILFALPTMATAESIFSRARPFFEHEAGDGTATVNLAHSKSRQSKALGEIGGEGSRLRLDKRLLRSKLALESDFVVCTVDQVIAMAYSAKHVDFKHLGVAGKALVIDEVHSYDAYMCVYLEKSLAMCATYGVPVVLLSATLLASARKRLMRAYASGLKGCSEREGAIRRRIEDLVESSKTSYPRLTAMSCNDDGNLHMDVHVGQEGIESKTYDVRFVNGSSTLSEIVRHVERGARVGVVCDTVRRAFGFYLRLRRMGVKNVRLVHSNYRGHERLENDAALVDEYGPGHDSDGTGSVVVGTQVFEQSLNVDFDVMFTDIAPIESILQRLGRLWRHPWRTRPGYLGGPLVYVMGAAGWDGDQVPRIDRGICKIYEPVLLLRTIAVLVGCDGRIVVPDDMCRLVESVDTGDVKMPEGWLDAERDGTIAREHLVMDDRRVAATHLVGDIKMRDWSLDGWMQRDDAFSSLAEFTLGNDFVDGKALGESGKFEKFGGVRKGRFGVEVIPIRTIDGCDVVWDVDGRDIDVTDSMGLSLDDCLSVMSTSMTLPRSMSSRPDVVAELLEDAERLGWDRRGSRFRNYLPLVFDESGEWLGHGLRASYGRDMGLWVRGVNEGESRLEELFDVEMQHGKKRGSVIE